MNHLHLLRPWWLLALIPLVILLVRLWRNSSQQHQWRKVCDAHLLPYLLETSVDKSRYLFTTGLSIAWLFSLIALCGPAWERSSQAVYQAQQAQVILLDLSASMLAPDLKPDRLTRARYKLLDILQLDSETQTGLIVFSGEPFVVSPLTQDAKTIASMVPLLESSIMPVAGFNLSAALLKAEKLFKQANTTHGQIILLTASQPTSDDEILAKKLSQQGYSLTVLGIGTVEGAPIPEATDDAPALAKLPTAALQRLAQAGGGKYHEFTPSNQDIDSVLQDSASLVTSAKIKKTSQTVDVWADKAYWWLLPVIIITALVFRRGWFTELTQ